MPRYKLLELGFLDMVIVDTQSDNAFIPMKQIYQLALDTLNSTTEETVCPIDHETKCTLDNREECRGCDKVCSDDDWKEHGSA